MAQPWSALTLCTDSDLRSYESRMPDLAMAYLEGATQTPTTGKRALAKSMIQKELSRKGVNTDTISNPEELKDAAVFLELHLIFNDIGDRIDFAPEKAAYYGKQYDYEIGNVRIIPEGEDDTYEQSFRMIPVKRS